MNRLTRVYPVIASLIGVAFFMGCTDEATAPSTLAFETARAEKRHFAACVPQTSASNSAWIGPKGGVLRAGGNVLKIPEGALHRRVLITMQTTRENINHVVFGPEGLVFNSNALPQLQMSYQNCSLPEGTEPQVVYVSQSLEMIEATPSSNDPATQTVSAKLSHFSDYVLSTYAVVY